jgi:aminopeptidase N
MLTVPEENYLFEQIPGFEVDNILNERESLLQQISDAHASKWLSLYETYQDDSAYQPDAAGMADRALSNIGFAHAARTLHDAELADFVRQHYAKADNLTDRRAALRVACHSAHLPRSVRDELLQDFYDKWRDEALVIDMWFSLQAQSPLTTLAELAALEQHEKFDLTNPNRVRSVYSAFGMYNHKRLHAIDGSGYQYLAAAVSRLDRRNPQLAARIATPLTRWQRYDERRQALMRSNLEHLVSAATISKDLYEIVTKSLGV